MRTFLMITLAIGFPLTVVLANEAQAVQDTPTTINGVETVCTGVGSAKDDLRWSAYPVKIVLATTSGANLANAHISLTKGGKEVAGLDCDAPWILFKAPVSTTQRPHFFTGLVRGCLVEAGIPAGRAFALRAICSKPARYLCT